MIPVIKEYVIASGNGTSECKWGVGGLAGWEPNLVWGINMVRVALRLLLGGMVIPL